MTRRLLNPAHAPAEVLLSLLPGLAVVTMWVRGRSVSNEFTWWHGTPAAGVEGCEWQWTLRAASGTVRGPPGRRRC